MSSNYNDYLYITNLHEIYTKKSITIDFKYIDLNLKNATDNIKYLNYLSAETQNIQKFKFNLINYLPHTLKVLNISLFYIHIKFDKLPNLLILLELCIKSIIKLNLLNIYNNLNIHILCCRSIPISRSITSICMYNDYVCNHFSIYYNSYSDIINLYKKN